ncbi:proton-translocating NADH-quinone oxidoreductase, chain M [Beutenbergia cavernae DSM 12333]|uniref:Proton-translocating NADH-quinone oxidoreductase, chain M n=1 Tax=Beutenbergia cavernae (strain ATCC BAA-8 / DSM 12333 / CCUG 43141 / JCM 11478 / NBRC 16432 / NCIMB 13614 / HKI 0122) TaxID=471853 RepID=C5C0R5_BEUC1|nr:NADH-quinone oxidoreductase subunit M [Beutenbergia cavernae]ACQ81461.1 proton-translocating NADH-quinone oxidoreductase, chain M [Beutenbergia cavernae DSM 12333]
MSTLPWITTLIVVPLVAAVLVWLVPALHRASRIIGLVVSVAVLGGAIAMATQFEVADAAVPQFTETHSWIPAIGASYAVGLTGLGLLMVLLATFLVPLVLAAGWNDARDDAVGAPGSRAALRRQAGMVALVLALEAMMIAVFAAQDVFLFYVLFEAMLLPVYFLIGLYGGPARRAAAVKFLLYSLAGGLIMLAGVIAVYFQGPGGPDGFLIANLSGVVADPVLQRWLFAAFFIAFAVKAPMWPVHTWLPDAAAQAPAGTSTLLVGVLDKVGTFGMIALCLPLFPEASAWAAPAIIVLALVSIIYGGLVAIGQQDLMRFVAFTSVSHFGFIVLGIYVGSSVALTGAMLYMLAHGISTAGLFLVSGFLTDRGKSRRIDDYGGLQKVTPVIAGIFLVSGLASIALPGLSGFVPEYLVLLGSFDASAVAGVVATAGVIIAAIYVLLTYQRIFTGPPPGDGPLASLPDLGGRERWVMVPIVAAMLVLGFYPAPALDVLTPISDVLALAGGAR